MASKKDYYDILGIRRGASEEEIEKAYLKLARTYQSAPHPGNKTAEFRFKEILEAYEILSDKTRREKYDLMGLEHSPRDWIWEEPEDDDEEGSLEGFEDVLEGLRDAGGEKGASARRGKDLHFSVEIDFESAVRGVLMEVKVRQDLLCKTCKGGGLNLDGRQKTCERCGGAGQIQIGLLPSAFSQECTRCGGSGKVWTEPCAVCSGAGRVNRKKTISLDIPPGVNNGCVLYLSRNGHSGAHGGLKGDLVARVKVKSHPYFQRKGDDVYLDVPLTIWEAALGTEIEVPTLDGPMKVQVPAGVQPGEEMRLGGKGTPFLEGEGQGDQVLVFHITVPREVDSRSKKILKELKERNPNPDRQSAWRTK